MAGRTQRKGRNAAGERAPRDFAQEITDRIVELIESGETLPWRRPWTQTPAAPPLRVGGEPYQGVNALYLGLIGQASGYASPWWMTFQQALKLGAAVRKGERGSPVVYYGTAIAREENAPEGASGPEGVAGDGGDDNARGVRFMKGYTVFNAGQIDGLPESFYVDETPLRTGAEPIETFEAFFRRLPVPIRTGFGHAAYRETTDEIVMPDIGRFHCASQFYSTLLHEAAHASGVPSRLNRSCFARYHKSIEARAEEELVAEIASAIGGPRMGLPVDHIDDHAAYLKSWLKALKSDSRHIFRASAAAQRAVDWIFAAAGAEEATVTTEAA